MRSRRRAWSGTPATSPCGLFPLQDGGFRRDTGGMAGRPAPDRAARWCHDPTGRHEDRFWDGSAWTMWVSDRDELGVDLDTDPSRLDPPHPVGHRERSATWIAVTDAVLALLAALGAHFGAQASRNTAGSGGAFYAQLGATLGIELVATAAIVLAVAAIGFGITSLVRYRHAGANVLGLGAIAGGSIGLAIAISALTRI